MAKKNEIHNLNRADHIRQEAERARKYGQSPRSPISLAPNFRVEGIMPLLSSPVVEIVGTCDDAIKNDLDHKGSIPRSKNPYIELADVDTLCTVIEANLERLGPNNRRELIPEILRLFGDVTSQVQDVKRFESLHKRILIAAFGEGYFKNMRGREGSHTARK